MRFTGSFKLTAVIVVIVAAVIAVVVTTAGGGTSPGRTGARKSAPAKAPGFSVAALGSSGVSSGKKISLDGRYAGKPVIVNFWASWCAPCQKETPLLARWYSRHRDVNLVGLDENDSAAAAVKFAKAKGVTYPLGFDPRVKVALSYGVQAGIPQTFFLNARHQIVDRVYGALTTAGLNRGFRLAQQSG
jgi:cytochrome c biogenesis protein CcmG/thiol:disulfide interchange protein DsbE